MHLHNALDINYSHIYYITCYLFIIVYSLPFMCYIRMMSVILSLIHLYKLRSFLVLDRSLEAQPPTEIQFSLYMSLMLSNGSHCDHPGGASDLRG